MMLASERGQKAEQFALRYLTQQGLTLITQNYRCYYGEIDLIMQDHSTLVFIEVRCRGSAHYGSAVESVSVAKFRCIVRTAHHYLSRTRQHQRDRRIDVVGIELYAKKIEWVKHAFEVK